MTYAGDASQPDDAPLRQKLPVAMPCMVDLTSQPLSGARLWASWSGGDKVMHPANERTCVVRRIIVTEFLSLDGVMEKPAWTVPYWNDETARFKAEETSSDEHLLLGRVTYEGFAAAWPQRTSEDPGARYFNGTRKYVASRTLAKLDWNNSVLLQGDLVEEAGRLRQEDGPDIVVHGSGKLVQTLLRHDLVDRVRLLVYPVVLGAGQRLFEEGTTARLKLVEARPLSTGVIGLIYEPERS